MNEAQNNKYWRRWSAVSKANQWRWVKGRLVDEAMQDSSEHHVAVWRIAKELADKEQRAVLVGDLRHACHVCALGFEQSHLKMTSQQFDRLLILWGNERDLVGLLMDPLNLSSLVAWTDPTEYERHNTVIYIRQLAPEALLRSICLTTYQTHDWEGLTRDKLLALGRILRNRSQQRSAPY